MNAANAGATFQCVCGKWHRRGAGGWVPMKPRIDLAASIPLPSPLVLFVEPTNVCNFKCGICPESFADYGEQAGYYQKMNPLTWQRVWESLAAWHDKPVVRFYHVGEPLLNRELPAMILGAGGLGCRTELTTNASRLGDVWATRLLDSGLDYVRISVYGTSDAEYCAATNTGWTVRAIRENVMGLRGLRQLRAVERPHIYAELVGTGDPDVFRRQWAGIADECGVKQLHNWGDSLVQLGQRPKKQICPFPFYELAVKANGDVTVCCVDWSGLLVVGNVNIESLQEIWAGSRLAEIRKVPLLSFARTSDCAHSPYGTWMFGKVCVLLFHVMVTHFQGVVASQCLTHCDMG